MKNIAIDQEIKEFIKNKIKEASRDPEAMAEKIFKNIKTHWMFGKRSFISWMESPDVNPFVNMLLTRSGLLPLYTLHILCQGEKFGNEIMVEIEKRTSNTWSPTPGTVYPMLKELEMQKFIEGKWNLEKERPRRFYKITKKGKNEYEILKALLKDNFTEAINVFKEILEDIYPS